MKILKENVSRQGRFYNTFHQKQLRSLSLKTHNCRRLFLNKHSGYFISSFSEKNYLIFAHLESQRKI